MTVYGFLVTEVLSICIVALATYFLIVYVGADLFPARMRAIYRATRKRLAQAGWGVDTGAERYPDTGESGVSYDVEYPNRREES